jgi:hypothetical protein
LAERLERFTPAAVAMRETQYVGSPREGPLQPRVDALADEILGRLETRLGVAADSDFVPERVKRIRHAMIERLAALPTGDPARSEVERVALDQGMEDAFVAVQLYSYQVDYVAERPSIERIAETVDKYEEDFLGLRTANIRGARRGTIAFGEPVVIEHAGGRDHARRLGNALRQGVQALIDEINVAEPMAAG